MLRGGCNAVEASAQVVGVGSIHSCGRFSCWCRIRVGAVLMGCAVGFVGCTILGDVCQVMLFWWFRRGF